jgi:iron complex transport system substrate-binding protein
MKFRTGRAVLLRSPRWLPVVLAATVCVAVTACGSAASGTVSAGGGGSGTQTVAENLTAGCVKTYNTGVDYFPDKVTPSAATGFTVSYHDSYKVVTVDQPYPGAKPVSYVLVQCGTPAPKLSGSLASAEQIQIPVTRVDAESTTQLPDFDLVGSVGTLVGVADTAQVSTPSVVARIKAGAISQFEGNGTLNTEQVIATAPDLFLTQGVQNKSYATLQASGVKVVADADWLSETPLARAQWIEFVSLFLNKEAEATSQYNKIATAYNKLVALAATATTHPTVVDGDEYQGTWYAAGGNSYVAAELKDAGADYIYASNKSTGSTDVSIEDILKNGGSAQFWVDANPWTSLAQAKKSDSRYASLAAFKTDNVWTNSKDVNAGGGNDYYEEGVVRPDLVLADLIAIFHPSLEPNHQFTFYERIPAK